MQINASGATLPYGAAPRFSEGCPLTELAICIPVRDEEAALPSLFDALDHLDRPLGDRVVICLLMDGCQDESVGLSNAYRARSRYPVTVCEIAASQSNAGIARHRAMLLGVEAVGDGDAVLLTTDGDSMPSVDWLIEMKRALQRADVVAGRIVREVVEPCPLQDRIESHYDQVFELRRRLDPVWWEAPVTHHCAGGANVGLWTAAYAAVGGFAPLAHGEDARLIDDAERAGLKVRRDAACVVRTSDRRTGRADGGLAGTLRLLDESQAAQIDVAHPEDAAWQYRMHAAARRAYDEERLDRLNDKIGLSHAHVLGVARDCPNAHAFAMRIVPVPPGGMRRIALPEAEAVLRGLVEERQLA